MYKTLNSKLILIFIVFMITVMATVGIFLMNSIYDYYSDGFVAEIDRALDGAAAIHIDEALTSEEFAADTKSVLLAYSSEFGFDSGRTFYLLDKDANVLASSFDDLTALLLTQNLTAALGGKTGKKQTYGADFFDYAVPYETENGQYVLYIKDDMSQMRSLSYMLFSIIIKALLIGLVIAVIMAFFLAKAITLPIQNITKGAVRLAAGDYSERLQNRSRDEIGILTRNFNNMASVIEDNLDAVSGEREKLGSIVDCLEAGVAAFDEDGVPTHINPSFRRLLSLPEEDKPTFAELTMMVGMPDITEGRLQKEKHIHIAEQTLSNVSTRELVVSVDFTVFKYENGKKTGYIAVIQNITEGAVLEKSRREFIANVSHELRTPLTSIKGATETILDDDEMPLSFRRRFLNIVMGEADRMTRIVKDLLVLSRLDNRRMTWSPSKFDIGETLDRMCTGLQTEAGEHNHTLTYSGADDGRMPLYGDKERIEQVIANIIGNAIKYTPDGGRIAVTLGKTFGNRYVITVSDNGIGIPAADLEHLFERFYRVDKSRSIQAGGTGLGLSIAKEIVDAHGGEISVESTEGEGTKVTLTLPCDIRKEEKAKIKAQE